MQQTDKYKLNLVEKDDVFSPDALNQNTQKVENALAAAETALDQRVTALEVKKIVFGSIYVGSQTEIDLGFTPKALLLGGEDNQGPNGYILVPGHMGKYSNYNIVEIVENGFKVYPYSNRHIYCYVAFA